MKPFWISWYQPFEREFELRSPWWISGETDDAWTVCAAVMAESEDHAKAIIEAAQDLEPDPDPIQWRFCNEKPKGWDPFCDRFERADWMEWPAGGGA